MPFRTIGIWTMLLMLAAAPGYAGSADSSSPAPEIPPAPTQVPDLAPDLPPPAPDAAKADVPPLAPEAAQADAPLPPPQAPKDELSSAPPAPLPLPEAPPPEEPGPDSLAKLSPEPSDSSPSHEVLRSDIPRFHLKRPAWAVELTGLYPKTGATPDGIELSLQLEYQPRFFQVLGVLGFGPSLNYNAPFLSQAVGATYAGSYSYGAQVRYQARFFREQILVPMAGFSYQYYTYAHAAGPASLQQGKVSLQGSFFGAMILLNDFEPSAAAAMYVDNDILRSYLVAELRNLSGTDGTINFAGPSYYLGLRLEFE